MIRTVPLAIHVPPRLSEEHIDRVPLRAARPTSFAWSISEASRPSKAARRQHEAKALIALASCSGHGILIASVTP